MPDNLSRQIELVDERLREMSKDLVALATKHDLLEKKLDGLEREFHEMHKEVSEIHDYANKWRGGFYALTGLGALIGAVAAFWDRVRLLWH